ncbi:ISAs1 family transposase [Rhodoblastus acidophilus]|uniref:ISAs1 family transposase n=1 Tax=Rhodoblastus acidophilus TaxID=1074 RepID=UPI0013047CDA|nr:ISAs1 family transposase [Rhodoblastus acidophilus]
MSKKSFTRVIASGNHLLTQVKDNQPNLRRRLELGSMGRKPSGSATSKCKGRNRWETRELTVFPSKAWFRGTPWEALIKTVLRLERSVWKRDPKTGMLRGTNETVFWVSSLSGPTPEQWNDHIRRHWRIENGSHYIRDVVFAEDASRIRKTLTSPPACGLSPTTCSGPLAATTSKTPAGAPPSTSITSSLCLR